MAHSDYIYGVKDGVLWIRDLNQGNRSVTNDVNAVMSEIVVRQWEKGEGVPPIVVYRDSRGIWDGIRWVDGDFMGFYPLSKDIMREAIDLAKMIYIGKQRGASL